MRAFAIGAFPAAARALRSAEERVPGQLDASALRVLGKALVITEQAGEPELQRAFDLYLGEGADVSAAVVATDLAHAEWQHGNGARSAEWVARALALVDGAEVSREHAQALAQIARFTMLTGSQDESIGIADRAIAMANQTGAHGARASALITRTTARGTLSNYDRVKEDMEEARLLALEHDETEVTRAYINLSTILLEAGDLAGALAAADEGRAYNERRGTNTGRLTAASSTATWPRPTI